MSNNIDKLVAEFLSQRSLYESFAKKLSELAIELLEINNISYSIIEQRVKTIESFREKLQRPGKTYKKPFKELPDIAGIRIILYYTSDIDTICRMLENEFSIIDKMSSDKRSELDIDQFGYLSVHKVIKLKGKRKNIPEWKRYGSLHCEVQVRTVLQHAWAAISHKLEYKRESEVPLEHRRKLNRLSGLFELADEQFSELKIALNKSNEEVLEKIDKHNLDIPIDLNSVRNYISKSSVANKINRYAEEAGIEILDYDLYQGDATLIYISNLLQINTIADLDQRLQGIDDSFIMSFFRNFVSNSTIVDSMMNDIGYNIAIVLYAKFFAQIEYEVYPWSDDYTSEIIDAATHFK